MHTDDYSHALFFCSDVQVAWASDSQWQWLLAMQGQIEREIFKQALEEKQGCCSIGIHELGNMEQKESDLDQAERLSTEPDTEYL